MPILAALFSGFFWWWATQPVSSPGIKKTFVIKKGESLNSVAIRLEKEKLIRSHIAFKIIVFAKGLKGKIQAGSFYLKSSSSPAEIATILTHGVNDIWLTFPEGWRREEFGRRLANNIPHFDYQEFLELTTNLEGYLFPDTYLIPYQATSGAVIKIFTDNFRKKTAGLNISKEQLILASIVEREARRKEDRALVAGILIKRWQGNWFLQADATVQYALANISCQKTQIDCEWWPKVTKSDLKIDSFYNTYKYKGLPPAPICNPGLSSIQAVLNPTESNYWYYLSQDDGTMHFAQTLEEHNQNIQNYLK